ncbi:MAG: tRNA (adenine37-N6)-methyltransferase [Frankiales bacterium]|jgi:tRNA-Thr(GGU) m(6)t(6)A37 methyltransferase TsaA|nr:tRNA (adenine37-N6)-methyltransferase [Frankiales bacterium]
MADLTFTVRVVAVVHSSRTEPTDDDWDNETTTVELVDPYGSDAVLGLETFSHLEVVYLFHRVDPELPVTQARHPRGNPDWPLTGIFAQRGKDRPNRIGISTCELLGVEGTTLTVRGLDAIDGTPVLDIKPYLSEFAPRTPIRQPAWSRELMAGYFTGGIEEPRGL